MKKSQEIKSLILQRFPEHWGVIRRLFQEDSEFADICCDYHDSDQLLRKLSESGKVENDDKLSEVRTIIRELEIEILESIHTSSNTPISQEYTYNPKLYHL